VTVLAAASPSAFDQPGTLGFLVVFGLGIILYFVFRSMAKHLRRVNEAAAAEQAAGDPDATVTTASRADDSPSAG
jgi:HAMP domain-containing protein